MGRPTEQFFATLPSRAPTVLREPIDGALQINLNTDGHTEHWHVELHTGAVRVCRDLRAADTVWRSSAALFDRLVTGEAQGIAALLRNETTISGNLLLFLAFRRFFPAPPGTRDPRAVARERPGPGIRPQTGRPG
ncbi:SCP2 sterol-binding domain-containing protein [Micromonospora sp. WMMD882]|uniref:SCP2 sterol-binding domain-containing protein n=1 Tax=Micromonospora sp. WMMD882 TaxID=3015151 RepID=UPI00248BB92A|nr:SCP2 sterol-binding domain-containing protein [Micromonospora sp. WMMD882]WBB78995.1 SCP2 sterol-binding domain-containing protein [Micromonospora sp. WMMD882]